MKASAYILEALGAAVVLSVICLLLAGCQTATPIDWSGRVGHYSYDQAVAEFGPPDATNKLTNNEIFAEWVKHGSADPNTFTFTANNTNGTPGAAPGALPYADSNHKVLGLTFGSDSNLVSWQKNY
jgi:hypothetical protein